MRQMRSNNVFLKLCTGLSMYPGFSNNQTIFMYNLLCLAIDLYKMKMIVKYNRAVIFIVLSETLV